MTDFREQLAAMGVQLTPVAEMAASYHDMYVETVDAFNKLSEIAGALYDACCQVVWQTNVPSYTTRSIIDSMVAAIEVYEQEYKR